MQHSLFAHLANPSERVAWTADISYWITGRQQAGDADADPAWAREEGYLHLCRTLGILPYYWYERFWLAQPEYDDCVRVESTTLGHHSTRTWRTPLGDLREEVTYLPQSCSSATTRYPVQNVDDLRMLISLLEHRQLRPDCLDDYPARLALWQQYGGIPSIALPRSPLAAFMYEWAGVEAAVYLISDHPDLVHAALTLMEQQEAPIIDAVCALGPPLVHFADNLSSSNMGSLYDAHMAGAHLRRLERLHAAGIRCAVHLDGTVRKLLPKLAAVGFDAIEALTPQPAGDVAIEDMRAIADNPAVILWGGVPGVMFAPPYTWADMEAHVRRVLRSWQGTPFILGVADQVPPDGDIEFCQQISEMVGQIM
jgi:hypothetical protein